MARPARAAAFLPGAPLVRTRAPRASPLPTSGANEASSLSSSSAARRCRPWAMGVRAVENFDGSFVLDEAVESVLVEQLTAEEFIPVVAKQGRCSSAEFTGVLFQPVPYSAGTPRGMPRAVEAYARDGNYVLINVPPQMMFKARCFRPSRLCAVFRRVGVDAGEVAAQAAREELRASQAAARARELEADQWAGLGPLIQESFHAKDALSMDDDELDKLVV